MFFTSWQERGTATGIIPTPNTPLSSLPVGSMTSVNYQHHDNDDRVGGSMVAKDTDEEVKAENKMKYGYASLSCVSC